MTSENKIVEYINKSVSLTDQEAEIFSNSFKEVKIYPQGIFTAAHAVENNEM